MLYTEEIRQALLSQWRHEVENSHFYLSIASLLAQKGFKNIAKIFKEHYKEESSHAEMIINLMDDLDIPVVLPSVSSPDVSRFTCTQIGDGFYQREYETTKSLEEIVRLAVAEKCGIIEQTMRKMVEMQRSEMDESLEFRAKARIVGDDWKAVLLWDAVLCE